FGRIVVCRVAAELCDSPAWDGANGSVDSALCAGDYLDRRYRCLFCGARDRKTRVGAEIEPQENLGRGDSEHGGSAIARLVVFYACACADADCVGTCGRRKYRRTDWRFVRIGVQAQRRGEGLRLDSA